MAWTKISVPSNYVTGKKSLLLAFCLGREMDNWSMRVTRDVSCISLVLYLRHIRRGTYDLSSAWHMTCLANKTVWQWIYHSPCQTACPVCFCFDGFPCDRQTGPVCECVLACVYVADVRALVCVLRIVSAVFNTVWGRPADRRTVRVISAAVSPRYKPSKHLR